MIQLQISELNLDLKTPGWNIGKMHLNVQIKFFNEDVELYRQNASKLQIPSNHKGSSVTNQILPVSRVKTEILIYVNSTG